MDATPNEIKIQLKFNYPEAIAYSRMQSDLLGIYIVDMSAIKGAESDKALIITTESLKEQVVPK